MLALQSACLRLESSVRSRLRRQWIAQGCKCPAPRKLAHIRTLDPLAACVHTQPVADAAPPSLPMLILTPSHRLADLTAFGGADARNQEPDGEQRDGRLQSLPCLPVCPPLQPSPASPLSSRTSHITQSNPIPNSRWAHSRAHSLSHCVTRVQCEVTAASSVDCTGLQMPSSTQAGASSHPRSAGNKANTNTTLPLVRHCVSVTSIEHCSCSVCGIVI